MPPSQTPRETASARSSPSSGANRVVFVLLGVLGLLVIATVGTFAFYWLFLRGIPVQPPPVSASPVRVVDSDADWLESIKNPRTRELARALDAGDPDAIDRSVEAMLAEAGSDSRPEAGSMSPQERNLLKAWAVRRGHSELTRVLSDDR